MLAFSLGLRCPFVLHLLHNKAYSPPCAFMSFATCPLPPQNHLALHFEAGELYDHEMC